MPHIHKNRDGIATLPAGRILRIGKDFSCVFNAAALILVVFLHSYTWFRGMRQDVLALVREGLPFDGPFTRGLYYKGTN